MPRLQPGLFATKSRLVHQGIVRSARHLVQHQQEAAPEGGDNRQWPLGRKTDDLKGKAAHFRVALWENEWSLGGESITRQ